MTATVLPPARPTCSAGSASTRVNRPVGLTIACSGQDFRYIVVSPPLHGQLGAIDPETGAVTYTPSPGWFSPDDPPEADRFEVAAVNRGGISATQTVTVTVLPDAPTCDDKQATTRIDQAVTVQLPCDDAQSELSFQVVDPPDHGTLGPIDPRTGAVSYTPDAGWFSPGAIAAPVPDRFTFRASNTGGTSPVATASVTVVPAPPSCDPLDAEVDHDTPRDLQAQCATQGGAPQRYELVSGLDPSTSGTLTQDPGFAANGSALLAGAGLLHRARRLRDLHLPRRQRGRRCAADHRHAAGRRGHPDLRRLRRSHGLPDPARLHDPLRRAQRGAAGLLDHPAAAELAGPGGSPVPGDGSRAVRPGAGLLRPVGWHARALRLPGQGRGRRDDLHRRGLRRRAATRPELPARLGLHPLRDPGHHAVELHRPRADLPDRRGPGQGNARRRQPGLRTGHLHPRRALRRKRRVHL